MDSKANLTYEEFLTLTKHMVGELNSYERGIERYQDDKDRGSTVRYFHRKIAELLPIVDKLAKMADANSVELFNIQVK